MFVLRRNCHTFSAVIVPSYISLAVCDFQVTHILTNTKGSVSLFHWVVAVYANMLSCFSCVQLFAIPWTVACQAPLSMGFSRQEYWSG